MILQKSSLPRARLSITSVTETAKAGKENTAYIFMTEIDVYLANISPPAKL